MTRYLTLGILGLLLSFFILISAPTVSFLTDILGLIAFSIGCGLLLKNIRVGGMVILCGLAIVAHVINAWWFNMYTDPYQIGLSYLPLYVFLTLVYVSLIVMAINSIIVDKNFQNKIDKYVLPNRAIKFLTYLPTIVLLFEIFWAVLTN